MTLITGDWRQREEHFNRLSGDANLVNGGGEEGGLTSSLGIILNSLRMPTISEISIPCL